MSIEFENPLKIVLTAPFPAIRAGLRSLCASNPTLEVLADCNDPEEWPPYLGITQVFLMAPIGPVTQEDWRQVEACAKRTPILFLLSQPLVFIPDWGETNWGILPFSASSDDLFLGIHTCAAGYLFAQSSLLPASPIVKQFETPTHDAALVEPLTPRELEILQYLAQGFSNKQIAQKMKISTHTVKFHITSIYSKLGVNNRTEAARSGLRMGWVNL